ncbi:hypothetical protein EXIGLDRAFT_95069 [Exidia glandulosa HHB12029]|uniref:Uncharacterized protein n=1 Tax=Exidia glandulosa HHB12029 TaxID=1314781 RepID=A0A165H763_EXIGL|nr:hypothetical protein EXIGLDRAFT_95069 [Exidia glandulosa HHB12029]
MRQNRPSASARSRHKNSPYYPEARPIFFPILKIPPCSASFLCTSPLPAMNSLATSTVVVLGLSTVALAGCNSGNNDPDCNSGLAAYAYVLIGILAVVILLGSCCCCRVGGQGALPLVSRKPAPVPGSDLEAQEQLPPYAVPTVQIPVPQTAHIQNGRTTADLYSVPVLTPGGGPQATAYTFPYMPPAGSPPKNENHD